MMDEMTEETTRDFGAVNVLELIDREISRALTYAGEMRDRLNTELISPTTEWNLRRAHEAHGFASGQVAGLKSLQDKITGATP